MPPNNSTLLSILMPVRNEAFYLPAALKSISNQSFKNWELIAIDDGSTDETPTILNVAASQDTRIKIIHPKTRGLVNALNTGFSVCKAPLIARMDADDISHPLRFEKQVAYLDKHPEIGLVATSFKHFPRHILKQGMLEYEKWQNSLIENSSIMNDLLVESPFVHPSIMVRRPIMEHVGGYRDCGWPEDYDLWLRMATEGIKFAKLPDYYFFWRDHQRRATRTMSEYSRDNFRRCKCNYLLNNFLKSEDTVIIAGSGIEGRAWYRLLLEQKIRVESWIDVNPHKRNRQLHGATIRHPDDYIEFKSKVILAIGVKGAREQFRTYLLNRNFIEGVDFIAVS